MSVNNYSNPYVRLNTNGVTYDDINKVFAPNYKDTGIQKDSFLPTGVNAKTIGATALGTYLFGALLAGKTNPKEAYKALGGLIAKVGKKAGGAVVNLGKKIKGLFSKTVNKETIGAVAGTAKEGVTKGAKKAGTFIKENGAKIWDVVKTNGKKFFKWAGKLLKIIK